MKKVIVRLGNGLGNQLFTYAAAYSFAKKNNAELYVDDESGFHKKHKGYKYELHNLNITAPIVDKRYKFIGIGGRTKRKILQKFDKFKRKKIFLIEEKDSNKLTYYNSEQLDINFNEILFFEGYFQCEKYFHGEKDNLNKEFSFKNELINENSVFAEKIKNNNSVSIHLRQNKFLFTEDHKNVDQLNTEYLKNNIEIIKTGVEYFDKNIHDPKYFVWSNNFKGIHDLFPSKKFTLIHENLKKDPTYDLHLMSHCKHFILSPSTMHYWGAYLSKNKTKICLAPTNIKNISGYYGFSNNRDVKPDWWTEI